MMTTETSTTTTKSRPRTVADGLKAAGIEASRAALTLIFPEDLTVVRDKKHALYDPRVEEDIDEGFLEDIRERGVLEPIRVRKNGLDKSEKPILQVVAGRRRTLTLIALNERLVSEGGERRKIPVLFTSGDDVKMVLEALSENANRKDESIKSRSWKVQTAMKCGASEEDIARALGGCAPQTVKNYLAFLSLVTEVQDAIDKDVLPVGVVEAFADVPREDQAAYLQQILEAGVHKRHEVKQAVRDIKKGGPVVSLAKKMWGRPQMTKLLDELEQNGDKSKECEVAKDLIAYFLGDTRALANHEKLRTAVQVVRRRNRK